MPGNDNHGFRFQLADCRTVLLLKPFRTNLAVDCLPSGCSSAVRQLRSLLGRIRCFLLSILIRQFGNVFSLGSGDKLVTRQAGGLHPAEEVV